MYKRLLLSLFLIQSLTAQIGEDKDIYLYIDNFDASDPNIVTFDIMMDNREPVYGAQFDIMSGNGVYDDADNCICDVQNDGAIPEEDADDNPISCSECYFDNGLDRIVSAKENRYATSGDECEDVDSDGDWEVNIPGVCSNPTYTASSTCEEYGECNNGKSSFDYDCFVFGLHDDADDYPTCTVASLSDIGVDSDSNTLIDACEVENQKCDDVGIDDNGAICDLATFDNGDLDPNTFQYEYCADDASEATNCCVSAGAIFTNWDKGECEDTFGTCDGVDSASECGCIWDGDSWVGDGNTWYPFDLWTPYSLPAVCQANVDFDGINHYWNYANPDPSGDNYGFYAPDNSALWSDVDATNYQYCIVPGEQDGIGIIPGNLESYNVYTGNGPNGVQSYGMAGHCSITEGYCVGGGDSGTTNGEILDWPEGCCVATAGATWINPYRDYELCTQSSLSSGQIIPTQGTWTAYSTPELCGDNDGFWIGSINGAESNEQYNDSGIVGERGENFVDTDSQIDITSLGTTHLPASATAMLGTNNALGSGVGDRVIIFSLTGAEIWPITEYCDGGTTWNDDTNLCSANEGLNEVDCCTGVWVEGSSNLVMSITADKSTTPETIATIMSKNICSDDNDTNCPVSTVFSDAVGAPVSVYFEPYIWDVSDDTVGAGYSISEGLSDGICSRYAGETSANSSDCVDICGDGICNGSENFIDCQTDCETAADDGFCNLYAGETFENSSDCDELGCGDYVCSGVETSESCSEDCLAICGNALCDTGENETNCPSDCSTSCGNGVCENNLGEHFVSCAQDCPESTCGDGYYHHIAIGGSEGSECQDYQIVCGDGVYHHVNVNSDGIIQGVEVGCTTCEESEDEDCNDYEIAEGDGYYHYLGLTSPNGITADATNAEDDSSSDYVVTEGDNVCDTSENPGIEAACATSCGDGFYHHSGLNVSGTENDVSCPQDYTPAVNDGVCDGSSGTGASQPDGNGENIQADPGSCTGEVYSANGWSFCGDGACAIGSGGIAEDSSSCPADCVGIAGDGVCARWNTLGADGAALENCYTHDECTYNLTDFNVCGNGVCDDGVDSDYNWGEATGDSAAGTCDVDCAATGNACTFGENISSNSWYSYADCFECGDNFEDNDECQDGYGESSDPNDPDFCFYDCWDGCGDHICEGPENQYNCSADQVTYEFPDGPPYGEITINSTSTGDCLSVENDMPIAYSLSNNYPNPFNPSTTISYSVKNAGNVKIDIYNILGQHVYTLVNDYHVPGSLYQVTWNADAQSNIHISSGVYFYRMVSNSFSEEVMMTIIK